MKLNMKIKAGNYYLNSDACKNRGANQPKDERRVSGYYDNTKSALKDMVYETDTIELKEVVKR